MSGLSLYFTTDKVNIYRSSFNSIRRWNELSLDLGDQDCWPTSSVSTALR